MGDQPIVTPVPSRDNIYL